jgi:hypothetical protein
LTRVVNVGSEPRRILYTEGEPRELGRDVLTFQRMDGVAENFHTEQNRDLRERLAIQTGGQYWKPADLGKLAANIPIPKAGITMRETKDLWNLPLVFLVLLLLRFSKWWLCGTGGSSGPETCPKGNWDMVQFSTRVVPQAVPLIVPPSSDDLPREIR